MASTHVSLAPTSASGLLCNSSPLATAIAVATTEADVHALANVVSRQYSPLPAASWAVEMYGAPLPPAVAVTALHPKRASAASTVEGGDTRGGSPFQRAHTPSPPSPSMLSVQSQSQSQHQQQQQQQQRRVSVVRTGSVAESDDGSASTTVVDVPPGQPFTVAVASTGAASRLRKNVSWQCGLCGYHVLAMDQDGTPLPFATSAFGNILPLLCPRCKLSHTSWQSSTPFNEQGDHLNLPTTYSNRYVAPSGAAAAAAAAGASAQHSPAEGRGVDEEAARHARTPRTGVTHAESHTGSQLRQRAAAASISAVAQQRAGQLRHPAAASSSSSSSAASVQRRAYYCGLCNRRLLRVDANGELVDMDREADGSIRPIRCPGCGEMHGDWVVKPYAVRR